MRRIRVDYHVILVKEPLSKDFWVSMEKFLGDFLHVIILDVTDLEGNDSIVMTKLMFSWNAPSSSRKLIKFNLWNSKSGKCNTPLLLGGMINSKWSWSWCS